MTTLNLTAKDQVQERIKSYLENNASDILADKINNGVSVEKDGKRLINLKDLDGFMKFAHEQVLETINKADRKGEVARCLDNDVVYGWAVHYFEEDSIIGKLYNQDGTEYKPPVQVKKPTPIQPTKPITPPKPKEPNLFDMIAASEKQENKSSATVASVKSDPVIMGVKGATVDDDPTIDQIADSLQTAINEKHNAAPKKDSVIERYEQYERRYPDRVIVIRIGDFYEVFGQKAELAARELSLTLTGKRVSDTERVPMCGFPYHAKDLYINKLRKSRSVVIIDGEDVQKLDTYSIEDIIDGEYDEADDDLTEEEMQQFDGDIQEPTGIPKTVMTVEQKDETKYILTKDDIVFEPSALQRLHEILGDILA